MGRQNNVIKLQMGVAITGAKKEDSLTRETIVPITVNVKVNTLNVSRGELKISEYNVIERVLFLLFLKKLANSFRSYVL